LVECESAVFGRGEVVALVEAVELFEWQPGRGVTAAQDLIVAGVGVFGGGVPPEEEAALLVAECGQVGAWVFAAWVGECALVERPEFPVALAAGGGGSEEEGVAGAFGEGGCECEVAFEFFCALEGPEFVDEGGGGVEAVVEAAVVPRESAMPWPW
jgi:hypothetical protein